MTEAAESVEETTPDEPEVQESEVEETVQPDEPETTVASAAEDPEIQASVADETVLSTAVTRSLRPPKRRPTPDAQSAESAQEQENQTGQAPTSFQTSGIELLALEGLNTTSRSSAFSVRASGNSADTNYAGQVLTQLNRAPLANAELQGTARVQFQINADGTLDWVRVLGSSGSVGIERAATAQVRRAAPFPPPPGGTTRRMEFIYRNR